MQVIFTNTWYSGQGRFRKSEDPQLVPDEFRDMLPSSARIVEDSYAGEVLGDEMKSIDDGTLRAFDTLRAEAAAYDEATAPFMGAATATEKAEDLINRFKLDRSLIEGSGRDGKIVAYDVERYINEHKLSIE